MATSERERAALLTLVRTKPGGLTIPTVISSVLQAGSAMAVWEECQPAQLLLGADQPAELEESLSLLTGWREDGLSFVSVLDDDYPSQLREIHEAPPFLFFQGDLRPHDRAVSVVGTRRVSENGAKDASTVSAGLADAGLTVVSGLALGVDTLAHESALRAGGRTVAIMGTGILKHYPASNRPLRNRIEREGLVLSQFTPPDSPPTRHSFPIRNATISGYGQASIIIEAGETSGTRGQARRALKHGRPVILMERVATGTKWGREMASLNGVRVASSPEEAIRSAISLASPLETLLLRSLSSD